MRVLVMAVAALLTALPALAQEMLDGRYRIEGQGLDGKPYSGEATITQTSDVNCQITWVTGVTTATGICMRSGEVFSAAFVLQDKIGMLIYDIRPDGALHGFWTMTDWDGVGYENLTPLTN